MWLEVGGWPYSLRDAGGEATARRFPVWGLQRCGLMLALFAFPEAHHKRMRSTNGIERSIQQERARRISKVRAFPNPDTLERLSTAVLIEIDEKRETETKAYLKWEQLDD